MQKGSGVLFLFLVFCTALNLSIPGQWTKGYSARRSDWSESECDYSTNAVVHNFYHESAKWYRTNRFERIRKTSIGNIPEEIILKVMRGDTVRIGFDYYSRTSVSMAIVPLPVLQKRFDAGQVYVYRVYRNQENMVLEE